jgi:hypothetical protein
MPPAPRNTTAAAGDDSLLLYAELSPAEIRAALKLEVQHFPAKKELPRWGISTRA